MYQVCEPSCSHGECDQTKLNEVLLPLKVQMLHFVISNPIKAEKVEFFQLPGLHRVPCSSSWEQNFINWLKYWKLKKSIRFLREN